MACPRRNSRRRWSPPCSRSWARAAQAAVHGRDQRRRLGHEPVLRPSLDIEPRRRCARCSSAWVPTGRSARTRTRSRPGLRGEPARPGLLRLRLQEVGSQTVSHLRFGSNRSARLSHLAGQLRRLPPLRVARARRGAGSGGTGSDAPAQLPTPAGSRLGRARASGSGADPRQADQAVRDRRGADRTRCGPRRADEHGASDVLLCDLGRARARGGDRADQDGDRQDVRQARRRGRGAQPDGGRPLAGAPSPRRGARAGDVRARARADGSRARAGVRPHRDRGDDGRPRR